MFDPISCEVAYYEFSLKPGAKRSAPISREAAYVPIFETTSKVKCPERENKGEGRREEGREGEREREGGREFWVVRSLFDFIDGWLAVGGWLIVG